MNKGDPLRGRAAAATQSSPQAVSSKADIPIAALHGIVARLIAACEGCRLVGPVDQQIAFQAAVRDYRALSEETQ